MPSDKKLKGIKTLSELSEEDLAAMGSTGVYLSINLSLIVYECFMAGIPEDEVIEGVKMLYKEISNQVREKAN